MKKSDAVPFDPYQFLKNHPLFTVVSQKNLSLLAQSLHTKKIPKGGYIFLQDDPAEAIYIVQSGAIAIVLDSLDGRELVINELHPGDCFGELAVLTQQPRSTGAVACDDSTVCVIQGQVFLTVLESENLLARRFLDLTARRLWASSERESALAFLDAEARLARVLLHLDRKESDKGFMTVSQSELAQRSGSTRQTVAKIIGQWRRSGWLLTGRGRIMLLNRAALQRLIEQS